LIAILASITVVLSLTTPELRTKDIAMATKQHQDPPLKGIRVLEFAGLAPGTYAVGNKSLIND
jgi:hypothetical protein